jgi:hypothetical protein
LPRFSQLFHLAEAINLAGLTQLGNQEAVRIEQRGKGDGQRATFYGGNRHLAFHCRRVQTTAQQATASTAETLAKLSATIAGQYPSARALVLARGNCILHEYDAYNSPEVQWPVHSVTKSVLSILVGIAIDENL